MAKTKEKKENKRKEKKDETIIVKEGISKDSYNLKAFSYTIFTK